MDADTSALRSGRQWRRRPPPFPQEPKPPEALGVDAEAPGSPSPGGAAAASAAALFSCGVCRGTVGDPVVTPCGHLFCWPCLYRWVRRRGRQLGGCPVCKSAVAVEPGDAASVTPIYGVAEGRPGCGGSAEGGGGDRDRALEVPPRPRRLQGTLEDGEEFREELRDLSRDVDALEVRMWRVMGAVAQLRVAVLVAYVAEIARRNSATGASSVAASATRRRGRRRRRDGGVLGTQSNGDDGGGDGVYRGTRSRRRQANL